MVEEEGILTTVHFILNQTLGAVLVQFKASSLEFSL
jgi:hypothetical protein